METLGCHWGLLKHVWPVRLEDLKYCEQNYFHVEIMRHYHTQGDKLAEKWMDGDSFLFTPLIYPRCVCIMHNWSVWRLGLMCCGRAVQRLWYPIYLSVWEMGGCRVLHMWLLLWIASSLAFSFYIFINHRSHREEPFKCKSTPLCLHTTACILAVSHRSFTVHLPTLLGHQPAPMAVSHGDQIVDG